MSAHVGAPLELAVLRRAFGAPDLDSHVVGASPEPQAPSLSGVAAIGPTLMADTILDAARELGARVGPVMPVKGKRPLWSDWPARATRTPANEPEWEQATGVGLLTGERAGYFVLDVDAAKGGFESLAELEHRHGPLPSTWRSCTGGGGLHVFFRWPGSPVRNGTDRLGPGLDVRGEGGQVVAPPSAHASGTAYRWAVNLAPHEAQLSEAPAWLLEQIRAAQPSAAPVPLATRAPIGDEVDVVRRAKAYLAKVEPAISGQGGHGQTWKAALAVVRGFRLSEDRAYELLVTEFNPRCQPPWSEKELRHKVRQAANDARVSLGYLADKPLEREGRAPRQAKNAAGRAARTPGAPQLGAAGEDHLDALERHGAAGLQPAGSDADPPPHTDADAPGAAAGAEKAEKKGALALVKMTDDCDLFVDDREDAHAAIPLASGGREIRRLSSRRFKSWLLARYFATTGQAVGRDAQDNAVRLLEARAQQSNVRHPLAERFSCEIGERDVETIWIDLGDAAWRAVRVTAEGWTVEQRPPILFRRHEHATSLPDPVRGGRLDELFDFLNVKEEGERVEVLAWLIATFFAGVPRPILTLHGVQGAAKTTSARVLRSLVDPSLTEVLSPPRNEEQLVHQLGKHAVPAYDNLSTMPDWMADALCRAVTGGASEKRSLYSDGDSVLVAFRRSIILTGINTPSHAPDLLSRTLMVELDAVAPDGRREEGEFWATFAAARPRLFGALLDALAATLRILPEVRPARLQRMADFTRVGAAAAEALGYGQAVFLAAYDHTAGKQIAEALDSDPVALALRAFLKGRGEFEWTGKTGDLFNELRPESPQDRNNGFPKSAVWLGRRLNILRPSLKDSGVGVEPIDLPNNGRGWRVWGCA